ncbi:hypothetical protein IAE49_04635 [Kosakonia sp. S58]|uniref:hypothetical protein n=1 Tax=unclassified Kosakonia TaxID=2632876 RepID=UPI0019078285|nr:MULTISPECIES: hypothetical protein [unclassified Kosakonia]MBK0078810.1 hypothetical protein [Kosakonia sp. S57]MBK0085519.1 hypothetical protein [Kosakonia sp. S58]
MALEEYSKYFMYGGVILTAAVTVFFCFLERQDKSNVSGIKHYLSSNRWQGEVMQTNIESWQKLNAMYGNDHFYDIDFFLPNDKQLYTAKSLIFSEQAHMLKKGLSIKVKKGTKGKMAVISIYFGN